MSIRRVPIYIKWRRFAPPHMGTRHNFFLKTVYQAKISLKTNNERKTCASIKYKWLRFASPIEAHVKANFLTDKTTPSNNRD